MSNGSKRRLFEKMDVASVDEYIKSGGNLLDLFTLIDGRRKRIGDCTVAELSRLAARMEREAAYQRYVIAAYSDLFLRESR